MNEPMSAIMIVIDRFSGGLGKGNNLILPQTKIPILLKLKSIGTVFVCNLSSLSLWSFVE